MRNYKLLDIVEINHLILEKLTYIKVAVDMTVGNGFDTLFLLEHFPNVIGFDIQPQAIEITKAKCNCDRLTLILNDHYNFDKYLDKADLFVFNLGWLPNSNKEIVTDADHTVKTLDKCIKHLNPKGIISIVVYQGNDMQKREAKAVSKFLSLNDNVYVQRVDVLSAKDAPILYLVELK